VARGADNLRSPENDGGLSPEVRRIISFALRSRMSYETITRWSRWYPARAEQVAGLISRLRWKDGRTSYQGVVPSYSTRGRKVSKLKMLRGLLVNLGLPVIVLSLALTLNQLTESRLGSANLLAAIGSA
jgi:hypothetical protein